MSALRLGPVNPCPTDVGMQPTSSRTHAQFVSTTENTAAMVRKPKAVSTGAIDSTNATVSTFLIAGKIEWAPNGSDDTLRLFNIADAADPEPVDTNAFAVMTADIDQSQLDTIGLANRQVSSLDEIRFATTYDEVMGREPSRGMVVTLR